MQIKDELKMIGCPLGDAEFKANLANIFSENNRDHSVDNLRCRWRDARDFCRRAREKMSLPETCDAMILGSLDNIRRDGDLNVGRKGDVLQLKSALKNCGINVDEDVFRGTILKVFKDSYAGWTVDQLLNRWTDAGYFCAAVRSVLDIACTPAADTLILACLLTLRKRKRIPRVGHTGV